MLFLNYNDARINKYIMVLKYIFLIPLELLCFCINLDLLLVSGNNLKLRIKRLLGELFYKIHPTAEEDL